MKRNTLTTAVVAGLTGLTGMVSVSNAVNVNPDGMGQVLLYPYYTARGGNDTLISIVNTTERGKAVKVRFIEAMNSREVLDFNLYMSPYDVWTAAIVEGEDGGGVMRTADTTCTVPYFYDAEAGFGEQAFLDFEYTVIPTTFDAGPQGIERTASGYIEVIEMGSMVSRIGFSPDPLAGGADVYLDPRAVEWASKHGSTGVPRSCAVLTNLWTDGFPIPTWRTDPEHGFTGSTGGLFGAGAIVNVEKGTMFSYNATAIDGFWKAASIGHSNPSFVTPDLSSGDNLTSLTFNNGSMEEITWTNSVLAVNAVLTLDELFNEYNVSDVANAATEWVLTFPTRRFHVDALGKGLPGVTDSNPIPPFTRSWYYTVLRGAVDRRFFACEDLSFQFWDREEQTPRAGSVGPIVSPPPPPEAPDLFQLCKEANVVRFSDSSETPAATEIFGEPARSAPFASLGYTNFEIPYGEGWARFDLGTLPSQSPITVNERLSLPGAQTGTPGRQVVGLPVIGFAATTYTNGNLGEGVLANYAGSFNHRGSRVFVNSASAE